MSESITGSMTPVYRPGVRRSRVPIRIHVTSESADGFTPTVSYGSGPGRVCAVYLGTCRTTRIAQWTYPSNNLTSQVVR
jgi:hypothetical protein